MNGFSINIKEVKGIELTPKMRVLLKDTTNATKLDELVDAENSVKIVPHGFAILDVHNEKSENPDYVLYLIIDKDNNKYVTGSPSFWNAFMDIWSEMEDADEDWAIEIYKRDSKNYKGKQFLTCSII